MKQGSDEAMEEIDATDEGTLGKQTSERECQGTSEGGLEREHQGTGEGGLERGAEEEKHKLLRAKLERAVQSKNVAELEPAVEAVKKERVPNCSELLDKVRL